MKPLSSALLRTQSDERLLLLVGAGQEHAFEAIVHRYRRPLERYCAQAISRSQAEDVVQQVLLKAWQALSNGAEVRSLKAWLFRIAQTTIIEAVHRSGFDYDELERSLRPLDGPDSELERRAVIRKTLKGLAALPEAQREALLRDAVDGESRAEIAEALGVSEGAVRQLLYRARARLRAAATAVTPLPLVNWNASLGQGSPAMEHAVESSAAASVGVGLAKASAIVAGAGVIAAGPVAVNELPFDGPEKARAHIERPAAPRSGVKVATVGRTRATPSQEATVASQARESGEDEESGRERDQGESRERENDSPESERATEDARDERSRGSGPSESEGPDGASGREDPVERSSGDSDSGVRGDEGGSGSLDEGD